MVVEISNWIFYGSIGILVFTIGFLVWHIQRSGKQQPNQSTPQSTDSYNQQMVDVLNKNGIGTPEQQQSQQPLNAPLPLPEQDHKKYPVPTQELPEIQEEAQEQTEGEIAKAFYGELIGFNRDTDSGTYTYSIKMTSDKLQLRMGKCAVIQDD